MAKKSFKQLTEREILGLAISLEEDDGRAYTDFAEGLRESHPATAKMFEEIQAQESGHRRSLVDLYRQKFGEDLPAISRRPADFTGLMDGCVWTLAPLFAAAFATHNTWATFLVGIAASLGAGISVAFAEALSDDGTSAGRGRPAFRGFIAGLMTAAGGLGHTLPFLISDFKTAFFVSAFVVTVELAAIAYIRHRYMDKSLLRSAFQVIVGGAIVCAVGILIGKLL